MSHSPLQLRVLLHHYYCPDNWTSVNPDSVEAGKATDYWMENGCLEEIDNSERDSGLQLTERGQAMVRIWLDAELPDPHHVEGEMAVVPTSNLSELRAGAQGALGIVKPGTLTHQALIKGLELTGDDYVTLI